MKTCIFFCIYMITYMHIVYYLCIQLSIHPFCLIDCRYLTAFLFVWFEILFSVFSSESWYNMVCLENYIFIVIFYVGEKERKKLIWASFSIFNGLFGLNLFLILSLSFLFFQLLFSAFQLKVSFLSQSLKSSPLSLSSCRSLPTYEIALSFSLTL